MFAAAYKKIIMNHTGNTIGGILILDNEKKRSRDIYVGQYPLCINNSMIHYSYCDTGIAHLFLYTTGDRILDRILNIYDKYETMSTHPSKLIFHSKTGYTLNDFYTIPCSLYVLRDIQFTD